MAIAIVMTASDKNLTRVQRGDGCEYMAKEAAAVVKMHQTQKRKSNSLDEISGARFDHGNREYSG
jgi:hypothetical protein